MSIEQKLMIVAVFLATATVLLFVYTQIPKRLKRKKFAIKWKDLQAYCRDKTTWSQALLTADKLLDDALKKRKFKGRSMGERMVSAQRHFSNNDDIWFAHNLCKKLKANAEHKLKEIDVKEALFGFRQGLRDLGALDDGKVKE